MGLKLVITLVAERDSFFLWSRCVLGACPLNLENFFYNLNEHRRYHNTKFAPIFMQPKSNSVSPHFIQLLPICDLASKLMVAWVSISYSSMSSWLDRLIPCCLDLASREMRAGLMKFWLMMSWVLFS